MYSNNRSIVTDFLIENTKQIPTRKLIIEKPPTLNVKAHAPIEVPPLIMPHLRFLRSLTFLISEYLYAKIDMATKVVMGSPLTKLELSDPEAISPNCSLCFFFQPK